MNEIRRKHFRFPAYDDEIGVKLAKNQRRVLFDGQDDLLTENNNQPMFEQMQEFHFAQGDAREQRKRRNLSNSKKSTIPKENLVPTFALFPGFTKACQVSSSVLFNNKNSILPPVSSFSPINLAGITLVLFNTKQSPGFKYSIISLNTLCSILPVSLSNTINLELALSSIGT